MTVTLIGSHAARHWFGDDFRRPGDDYDFHADDSRWPVPDGPDGTRSDVFVDSRLAQWDWQSVATPGELYTMKISHAFWEINGPREWNKHAADIVFLSRHGAQFIRPLYDILLPIWKERYRKNPTNTTLQKDEFFNDAVKRVYDHDSLHESVAYGKRPLYVDILADGETVKVDSSKFQSMDHATQIKVVREEVYATALERILIPGNYEGSPGAAYYWALRRTATSLFKGDWALFLMLNLDELMRPDCNYMKRHLENQHKLRRLDDVPAGY